MLGEYFLYAQTQPAERLFVTLFAAFEILTLRGRQILIVDEVTPAKCVLVRGCPDITARPVEHRRILETSSGKHSHQFILGPETIARSFLEPRTGSEKCL